jgi:prolipoprotein diacylglyceryltransferase
VIHAVVLDPAAALGVHTVLEMAGVFVGMRLLASRMRAHAVGGIGKGKGFALALGCLLGAILGSKLAVWLQRPDLVPATAGSVHMLVMGQSIVGALIGGLVGVEIAKRRAGIAASTGDAFVLPLAAGIAIGRIGCFLAGLHDDTFGVATGLPLGMDFGDGVARHPTQLYDIAFVLALACVLRLAQPQLAAVPGLAFKLFLAGYLGWRVLVDALKPVPFGYAGGLSGLQLLALVALAAYLPLVVRDLRRLHTGATDRHLPHAMEPGP